MKPQCLYCTSSALTESRDHLSCLTCGFVQPNRPDCVAIPDDLLSDLSQVAYWLEKVSSKIKAGEPIDLPLLELMGEQAAIVRVWAAEFSRSPIVPPP